MDWIFVLSTIVLAGGALGFVTKFIVMPVIRFIVKLLQFLDDWAGEPERPGIAPARPGVLQRLLGVEADVKILKQQMTANGGSSLADKVDRIEAHTVPPEARPDVTHSEEKNHG